jgi:hypothetical protein
VIRDRGPLRSPALLRTIERMVITLLVVAGGVLLVFFIVQIAIFGRSKKRE